MYCDLENVGCEADLNPSSVVQVFVSKFPHELQEGMGRFLQETREQCCSPGQTIKRVHDLGQREGAGYAGLGEQGGARY